MIKITNNDAPAYLASEGVKASKVIIRKQVESGGKKLDIPSHWSDKRKDNKIKDVLFTTHHGKCCYCERLRTRKREVDVEHYRPKAGVNNEVTHKGYWWLAYEWNNYLWSCKPCNQEYKKNEFPLLPGGKRAEKENDDLTLEKPCLINPRFDDPKEYLAYHKMKNFDRWLVKIIAVPGLAGEKKLRAKETIRILGLNRNEIGDDLVSERGECLSVEFENLAYGLRLAENAAETVVDQESIAFYTKRISQLREKLKRFVHPSRTFAGFFRYFLADLDLDYSKLIEE